MAETGRYFIVGGAGFIGGHFVDYLMKKPETAAVTVYDNFSSGREWHLAAHKDDARLRIVHANVEELEKLAAAMAGHSVVVHLASNPDIAKAATHPMIDFDQGTLLTQNVVEAMRRSGAKTILYASGSGIYGDLGQHEAAENHGPIVPVSTYGASKLAGEALISSYCYMFGLTGRAFRFGNVVGPRQTHGVGLDFAKRLLADGSMLRILGDGRQSKSYIHVFDVLEAVFTAYRKCALPFDAYNVATGDYITVTEIADLAASCVGLKPGATRYEYTGGDRGWKGDVPVVRLNTDKIRGLGWSCSRTSKEALQSAIRSLIDDVRSGQI